MKTKGHVLYSCQYESWPISFYLKNYHLRNQKRGWSSIEKKKLRLKATYRFLERYYCSVALRIWRKVMVDDIRDPTSTRIQNKKVVNDVGDELMDVVRKFLVYIWYSKVYFIKKYSFQFLTKIRYLLHITFNLSSMEMCDKKPQVEDRESNFFFEL